MFHKFLIVIAVGFSMLGLARTGASQDPTALSDGTGTSVDGPHDEETYLDLRTSRDRLTAQVAERYFNLVKLQEWTSDKGTTIKARYLSHDPDLTSVTLVVVKGYGAERTEKETLVPVQRLNKTCQSRVKQIDTIQKKLDELIASGAKGESDPNAATNTGAPMQDEIGAQPDAERPGRRGSTTTRKTTTRTTRALAKSPTADDGNPDPLGFAELPPVNFGAFPEGTPQ